MSDLRVAIRVSANAGNTRREIDQINRDLHRAGKDGAKTLADESWKATGAISKIGTTGATSYRVIRGAMRDTAKAGGDTRLVLSKTTAEFKEMSNAARKAARDAKTELGNADRQGVQPLQKSVDKTEVSFRRMAQSSGRSLRTLKGIAAGVRQEFDRIKGLGGTAQGQLAGLGVGVGVVAGLTGSARLDRQLIRTQQTAGLDGAQREEWRGEQWNLAKKYGIEREQVQTGFDTLIASGLSYDQAKQSSDAIAQATTVSGSDSSVLADALITGSSAFDIDLSKGGAALDMLQKMTVAGRQGSAELENLSSIFPKVGQDAKRAGMSFEQTLSFVETLSLIEKEPDRLGTLAQSTLRMFNNGQYRNDVTKATGVQFFDKKGQMRDTADVFTDLKNKYQKLTTDKDRARFMSVAFGKFDQDTQKGISAFLSGDRLDKFKSNTKEIKGAKPIFESDLKDNMESATAVGARTKATLQQAMDRMAVPLNKELSKMGRYLLDDLNLSGGDLLAGGAALGIGGYYAGRGAKAAGGAVLNKLFGGADVLKNVAVGKALEEAAGVTPVFITNWPSNMGAGGMPGVADIADAATGGKGKGKGGLLSPVGGSAALGFAFTQIGGAGPADDEGRLRMAQKNVMLNDAQRAYQTSFYRNRIALADQNPKQDGNWLSTQAQRLALQETGMTPSGMPVAGANAWAAGVADRAVNAGLNPTPAEARLQQLLDKPLIVEVRTDSNMITAEVTRRAGIEARRGK